jgi:phage tail-like protein
VVGLPRPPRPLLPRGLEPYLGFSFLVEIHGLIVAGFTEVSGLSVEIETTKYREGGRNDFEHELPGPARFTRLVLKRGVTDINSLWDWHEKVRQGEITRRNGSIILGGDSALHSIRRWNFEGAYPVKWTGPELRADSATVAAESIELVHQGIKMGRFV